MRKVQIPPSELKELLRRRDLTYGDVATLAGVTWSMVWQVINRRKTSRRVLDALSKLLGVHIEAVVEERVA